MYIIYVITIISEKKNVVDEKMIKINNIKYAKKMTKRGRLIFSSFKDIPLRL